jgi:ATP-dependent Lhr-like helicase
VREILTQATLQAPTFETRWRWVATRSLAVLRHTVRGKVPPPIQRIRVADLLAAVFPQAAACQDNVVGDIEMPDHPLVAQTLRDCLEEAMDTPGLERLLEALHAGTIRFVARDTPEPSPLSHALLNANPYAYLDDAPLEERRTRAVFVRRGLPAEVADGLGALDRDAIDTVRREAGPPVRDADELHDLLCLAGILRPVAEWVPLFGELCAARRATSFDGRWVAAERLLAARAVWGDRPIAPEIAAVGASIEREAAVVAVVRGRLEMIGPETEAGLGADLELDPSDVSAACLRLESEGLVLRGRFTPGVAEMEWCDRRLLHRIHRLTLGRLRREIEPVTPADLLRFLARWQHTAPGTQLHGEPGLAAVLDQLQGFEAPAGAWEEEILPQRIGGYQPGWLDALCLSGDFMWGRRGDSDAEITTRATPIAFWRRESAPFMVRRGPETDSAVERVLAARGALFYGELLDATGLTRVALDEALWALVAAGRATADGFGALRALGSEDIGRRARKGGRWALLSADPCPVETAADKHARVLLARYGVVLREVCAREVLPPWRELLLVLRRMEARGEIRGGRFVAGFVGEQFALPEAVDALRASRRAGPIDVTPRKRDPLYLRVLLPPVAA